MPARWERVAAAVKLRDELGVVTRIVGNGDVLSREDGLAKIAATGADGAMVGRALFGNPWFFHPTRRLPLRLTALPTHGVNRDTIVEHDMSTQGIEYVTLPERLAVLVEHTNLFHELLPFKNFAIMKKHYKAYVGGFPGAVDLRAKLMAEETPAGVAAVVHAFLSTHRG